MLNQFHMTIRQFHNEILSTYFSRNIEYFKPFPTTYFSYFCNVAFFIVESSLYFSIRKGKVYWQKSYYPRLLILLVTTTLTINLYLINFWLLTLSCNLPFKNLYLIPIFHYEDRNIYHELVHKYKRAKKKKSRKKK